ncbi:hypothetical protein [Alicyclobacillus dauci]|uniref:Uncharacterized protein n=1 Tax=Alicyclobacillus dauci TaxID=1475485 RepID=A0ABY6Z2V4_9BACL|nr:hypothetical protein [Alicyclobacillus dauci]WAH37075.1 hypothetical protein NZD86_00385 [Alicyclobacillus dauci]
MSISTVFSKDDVSTIVHLLASGGKVCVAGSDPRLVNELIEQVGHMVTCDLNISKGLQEQALSNICSLENGKGPISNSEMTYLVRISTNIVISETGAALS